jgi:four helix bundle protein
MPKIKSYRDLQVWQLSKRLVTDIYLHTRTFPKHELYGLAQQIQRAAVSVPSNIAEGHARASRKEFLHFLSISLGSLAEVETQLELAVNLGYLNASDVAPVIQKMDQLGKMIRALVRSLKPQPPASSPQPPLAPLEAA